MVETVLPDDLRNAVGLPKGATYGDAIALSQARQAIKGKPEAAREIREAIEGKTSQRDQEAEGRPPITTILIDRATRPDRSKMRQGIETIDAQELLKYDLAQSSDSRVVHSPGYEKPDSSTYHPHRTD
jgi:hypothetical protein